MAKKIIEALSSPAFLAGVLPGLVACSVTIASVVGYTA